MSLQSFIVVIFNINEYNGYGRGEEKEEELAPIFLYTGQEYAKELEGYWLGERIYREEYGRFLKEDAYEGDGLNLYAYCRNNPIIYYDPSGYMGQPNGTENGKHGTPDGEKTISEVIEENREFREGSFMDLMDANEAKRYKNYWQQGIGSYQNNNINGKIETIIWDKKTKRINTRPRLYTIPGVRSIIDVKLGSKGEIYYRETIFDKFGRKLGVNDYTDHDDPKKHTNPHHHPNPVEKPSEHKKIKPGLHPDTPRKGGNR